MIDPRNVGLPLAVQRMKARRAHEAMKQATVELVDIMKQQREAIRALTVVGESHGVALQ